MWALIFFIAFALSPDHTRDYDVADRMYWSACYGQGGVIVDSSCYDPVKLNEAKIFIQFG